MSFFASTPSFRRFHVSQVPKQVDSSDFFQKIKIHSFQPLKEAEEATWGWVSIANLLDTELTPEKVFKDRFLVLGFRVEKRRTPPLLFKAYLDIEEKELLKVKGTSRLTQDELKELKERVKKRCAKEFPPVSSLYEMVWDFKKKTVYFSGTGNTICNDMAKWFYTTFAQELILLDPLGLAALNPENQKALKLVSPTHFTEKSSPSARTDKEFLGEEFLTWIWYLSQQGESLPLENGTIQITMYDHLQLISNSGEEKVSVHGISGNPKEAMMALHQGKKLASVKMMINQEEEEWLLTLKGKTFDFKSVKTPPIDEVEEVDRFVMRMNALESLSLWIEQLYQRFLNVRLTSAWEEEELPHIREWIQKRSG